MDISDVMSDRKKEVLTAVVNYYISAAEPVGSGTIADKFLRNLSPATVRNVMAELEEMGYLYHPHTSAGRIPTDKGYRIYVDCLMKPRGLQQNEREEIRKACHVSGNDLKEQIKDVSRQLSTLSHHAGLAVLPRFTDTKMRHIDFLRLTDNRLLVILASQSGVIENRVIDLDETLVQSDLDRMSAYLNHLFGGLTIAEIKDRIIGEMREERNLYDSLLKKALTIGKKIMSETDEDSKNVFIEGALNLFEYPEFFDIGRMKEIFRAFEEKSKIIQILDKSMKSKGVHILIGVENGESEFSGCSLVAATYGINGSTLGSIGVIGPKRMDYSRIVPLVDYTAKFVEKILREESFS